eukprot:TRINITY_DN4433_c1_g2_i1.p1 TRINITY_DN4433_c1_g2~~TRINITY_DN4433_c1_g2_i1.p1  ORF type:complete len:282 (+),score=49.45 TRINITY_DN4433_c1_g2_i1:113-958(+)
MMIEPTEWKVCELYMKDFDQLENEDIVDVIKMAVRPRPKEMKELANRLPGRSKKVMEASNALSADPYSLYWINELGRIYASEGQYEKAANVLLRGWKRANEIPDASVRFHFLMKLCEASYRLGKPKQAFAVLKDMETPADRSQAVVFEMMACQVYCAVGDTQRAFAAFKRATTGDTFRLVVRKFALVIDDLRHAGCYNAVRGYVAKLMDEHSDMSLLPMLDTYVTEKEKKEIADKQNSLSATIMVSLTLAVGLSIFLYILYLIEQWSLGKSGSLDPIKDIK